MKKEVFFYRVYGLRVKSDVEIIELLELDHEESSNIDVSITLDKMPQYIEDEIYNRKLVGYNENNMWFKGGNTAIFNIVDGNKIIIETIDGYDLKMLKIYIMGIAFAMLMIEREQISIHGASIDIDGRGILIVGESGAGKSTLTTALRQNGYKLLSDDMSVLSNNSGNILINPSFPMQRISEDVMDNLKYNKEEYSDIFLTRQKYLVPVTDNFQIESIPLNAVFNLSEGDVNKVTISEVRGAEKLQFILNSIFRAEAFNHIKMSQKYFKKCLQIAKEVPIYKIVRPKNKFTVNQQIEIIEKTIGNNNVEELNLIEA